MGGIIEARGAVAKGFRDWKRLSLDFPLLLAAYRSQILNIFTGNGQF